MVRGVPLSHVEIQLVSIYGSIYRRQQSPRGTFRLDPGEEGTVGNIVSLVVPKQILDPCIASSSMMVAGLSGLAGLCLVSCFIPQAKERESTRSAE